MEYLNDYNDNAKIMKIFRLSLYHAYVLKLIIFYFNDIYTDYVMESLKKI